MNQQGIETHEWKWGHVKEACLDLKSWFWFALMFTISYVKIYMDIFESSYLTFSQYSKWWHHHLWSPDYQILWI